MPIEPKRNPSNRRPYEHGIWYISNTARNRTHNLFRLECFPPFFSQYSPTINNAGNIYITNISCLRHRCWKTCCENLQPRPCAWFSNSTSAVTPHWIGIYEDWCLVDYTGFHSKKCSQWNAGPAVTSINSQVRTKIQCWVTVEIITELKSRSACLSWNWHIWITRNLFILRRLHYISDHNVRALKLL